MRKLLPLYILASLILASCSSGGDFYKSSYPIKLKNGTAHKPSAAHNSNNHVAAAIKEKDFQAELIDSLQNRSSLALGAVQAESTNNIENSDQVNLQQTKDASEFNSNLIDKKNEVVHFSSNINQSDCPAINDLACQYLGEGIYKLTWSEPKIPIYNENGTLSEYRITRRTPEDNKAFLYKTPEPDCVDGTCTIIFKNLNNRTGYLWTVEARCSRSTFTSSNRVKCEPLKEIIENPSPQDKNSSQISDKPTSKKSITAILLIPILLALGIAAIFLLFNISLILGGLLLVIILIGCIYSISLASDGIHEANTGQANMSSKFYSTLAIVFSIIGILITLFIALLAAYI